MPLPEFDFIVVGTGAGGGHAAARLVNAGFSVLTLEAGGDFWETQNSGNEEKGYITQIGANDEMFWDWDYRCEAEVTKYVGTWAGIITVVAIGPPGATYTINGVPLVAAAARVSGANNYNDTLGSIDAIATDIWEAINDPANSFAAAGVKARTSRNAVIIDRIVPFTGTGAITLTTSDVAKGTAVPSTAPISTAQATVRNTDQSMGRMVGGSGNHFGYLCYRGSVEDYDEWDYAITKNTTAAVDGIGVLTGVMQFGFPLVDNVTGAGTAFLSELKAGDYVQDMTAPYPVGGTVPHKILSVDSDTQLTLVADITGKPFPASALGAFGLKNTIWNRTRMLDKYKAIEDDLQYGPFGRTPVPSLHGSNAFPATTLDYVGNDGLGDTGAWNVPPTAATSRVPVALDGAVINLTGSALPMPAGRVPPMLNPPTFHLTIDRNGENNWGDVTVWAPAGNVTGLDPYSAHKIPMNEIGKNTLVVPPGPGFIGKVAGGRGTGGAFHLNKYSERISQLVSAIDPIRGAANFTLRSDCLVDKVLCEDSGSGLTAVGVTYYQRDAAGGAWSPKTVYGANIVVAAGPMGSPAVLLRSGIGAIDRLAPHGIPQLLNLPGVGADVVTHQGAGSGFTFTLPAENNIITQSAYYAGLYKSSYTMSASRKADFAVGGHAVPALGPVLFDQGPDMRFNFGAGVGNEAGPISSNNYGLPDKQSRRIFGRTVNAGCNMFKCRSRGDGVRLRSPSPFDPPEYRDGRVENPNAFEVEAFVELATVLFTRVTDTTVPGPAALNPTNFPGGTFSAEAGGVPTAISGWVGATGRVATIHAAVTSALHAVSTIKMGPPSEKLSGFRSCLDQFGRLYGVKNLAVCDNCVHPTTTRGNPWLPTVGVAENLTSEWIARGGLSF